MAYYLLSRNFFGDFMTEDWAYLDLSYALLVYANTILGPGEFLEIQYVESGARIL